MSLGDTRAVDARAFQLDPVVRHAYGIGLELLKVMIAATNCTDGKTRSKASAVIKDTTGFATNSRFPEFLIVLTVSKP